VGIYRAAGHLIGDNTIQENAGHGVTVNLGALMQGKGDFFNLTPGPDIITQNGSSGISGWNGASLDIRNATITDNNQYGVSLGLHSTLRIYGSTVSGNDHGIRVYQGSAVILDTPAVSITNNSVWGILCDDKESSLAGDTSGVTSNIRGNVSCTGF